MRVPLAVLAMALALAGPATAATFTVNSTADKADQTPGDGLCKASDGSCTLRAAIQEANVLTQADEVDVPAGQYKLSLGGLNVTSSLTVKGAGVTTTTIDANHTNATFSFTGSGVDSLSGIQFTGQNGAGGGIYIQDPEVTLTSIDVNHETATGGRGGGIELYSGQLTLLDSAITDNAVTGGGAFGSGGGIDIESGSALIVGTTIARNTLTFTGAGNSVFGGGISQTGTNLTLRHDTILNNTATTGSAAQEGGNLYLHTATQISDSIIAGGQAGTGPDCAADSSGPTVTGKNIYGGGGGNCVFPAGTVVGASPGLGALGAHGGAGLTAVPGPGSAALDAAGACPDGNVDQRGTTTPVGSACDIGAVEASADLQVTLDVSAQSATPGQQVSYVAHVTDAGPDDAGATTLSVAPPAGTQVALVTPSAGSCTGTSCNLGVLAKGQSASVTVVVQAPSSGTLQTTANAAGAIPDPTPADATATRTTTITSSAPPPDTTAPVVSGLGANGTLRAGRAGRLKATLSEAATLKITIARLTPGRRVRGHCKARAHTGKRCTIAKQVGTITKALGAGAAVLALPARLGGHKLAPGRYRLTAVATDAAGNHSKPVRATVRVGR